MQKKIFRKMAMVLAALMVITNLSPLTIESVAKDMVTTESGYATTYAISELTNVGGYGYTATANEGTTDFAFEKQYQEARFAIPAEVLNAGLTGFKANVTSTNGGWLALKAQDAAFAELAVDYGNNSLAVSNENAKNIALMSTFEGEQTISVSSITFYTVNATVEEAAPSDPETPQTEVKEKTYSFAELTNVGGYGYTATANEGTTDFAFETQYQEARYAVPAEILNAGLIGFKANVTSTNGGWLALKAQDAAFTELAVDYGNNSLAVNNENVKNIALMSTFDGEQTISVSGITFYTANAIGTSAPTQPSEPTQPETPAVSGDKEYTLSELSVHHRWNGEVPADGVLTFPSQYYEFVADLPDEIDLSTVESITVNFAEATENLAIKLYDTKSTANGDLDSTTPVFYGNNGAASYTVTPPAEGKLLSVGIMSMDEGANFSSKLTGITIKSNGQTAAEKTVDVVYSKNLQFVNRWDASNVKSNDITFSGQYEEYVLALDEELDIANCRGLKLKVSGQGNEICFKIYDADMNEIKPFYGLNGKDEYSIDLTGLSGKIAKVAVMSLPEAKEGVYPYGVKVESVEAVMVKGSANARDDRDIVIDGDISLVNRWSSSDKTGNAITFTSQYHEYIYTLPEAIPTALIDEVVVKVKDQENQICIKLYNEDDEESLVDYDVIGKNEYTYNPKFNSKLTKIGFMSMADGDAYPYGVVIESITIKTNGAIKAEPTEESIVYTVDKMHFFHRVEGGSEAVEGNTLTMDKLWDEYYFDLDTPLNMERCKSISIKVAKQGGTVSYKIYDKNDKELQPFYGKNGNTVISPACDDISTRFAVMAHEEKGEYPFNITVESVTFVMDLTVSDEEPVEKGVEQDLRDFSEAVTAWIGDDFIVGTAISYQEFADEMEMEIVTKHFNAVTLGNELKPDSMLKANAKIVKRELNGEMVDFPELDFSNAERYLDYFVEWNKNHPDKPIKIRGHVLVWHSQTPEFFFHEGYNAGNAYVSPEEMTKRQELYIKSVAEHFTSADSKYKDLFYGWDVVNEAVSDGTGTYRNNNENSSWWAVYKSPDFIKNAFVFANKYMPASIELYYNDYNETDSRKMQGIIQLLKDVKATEGARIDAMGMQGHYQIQNTNPSVSQFETAVKAYCEVVGKVQVTELDFNQSTKKDDPRLAERYLSIFEAAYNLRAEGYNVAGITIWGVVDKHSWLQTANNVGGGSTNNNKKYPLLFDNNYKAKEPYYAIVEKCPERVVDPEEQPEVNPGHNSNTNPGHNSNANPGHNAEANPGHNAEANPGHNPEVNPGRGNGRGNNNRNEVPGRVDPVVEEVEETTEEVIEVAQAIVEPEITEDAAIEEAEAVTEVVEVAEAETPLAAAVPEEASKSMGLVLMLAIGAAVVALGGIAASLVFTRIKK